MSVRHTKRIRDIEMAGAMLNNDIRISTIAANYGFCMEYVTDVQDAIRQSDIPRLFSLLSEAKPSDAIQLVQELNEIDKAIAKSN